MYKYILFDLDGTLTDPGTGITNSVMYALKKYGIDAADRSELYKFIGPPLSESFIKYYGFSPSRAEEAIGFYREYFSVKGLYENEVYPGVPETLEALIAGGKSIILATSKPEEFAVKILEHFGLLPYFDCVVGATMDGRISKKADVIALALRRGGVNPAEAIMVGDREHDVLGAKANALPCIGVTYGYGTKEELEAAGAEFTVDSPLRLKEITA